jgi:hypothetical protein
MSINKIREVLGVSIDGKKGKTERKRGREEEAKEIE